MNMEKKRSVFMNFDSVIRKIRTALNYRDDSDRSVRAQKQKRPPLCQKGVSCGLSCISKRLNCRKTLKDITGSESKALNSIAEIVKKDFAKTRGMATERMGRGGSQAIESASDFIPKPPPTPIDTEIQEDHDKYKFTRLGSPGFIEEEFNANIPLEAGDRLILMKPRRPMVTNESMLTKEMADRELRAVKKFAEQGKKSGDVIDGDIIAPYYATDNRYYIVTPDGVKQTFLTERERTIAKHRSLHIRAYILRSEPKFIHEALNLEYPQEREVLGPFLRPLYRRRVNETAKFRRLEEEGFKALEELDPRTPTDRVITSDLYRRKAEQFAKDNDLPTGGVNGFTDLQTRMHNIAHAVVYDMLGMDSKQIKKFFNSDDPIAEEAIVNVLEQMSRGASPRMALANGVKLARVLSRGGKTAAQYRTSEFTQKLGHLTKKLFDNPDLYRFLRVVRKANRISRTVSPAIARGLID